MEAKSTTEKTNPIKEKTKKVMMKGMTESLPNQDPIKILERNVQAILNKLTPQNFDNLVAEFKVLKIDTVPKLEACVELIFEKAVDEHEFSQSYARMCEVLSGKKVTNDESSGQKPMNFQRMMITHCQKEFERDYMEGFDKEKYKAALAAEESEDKRKMMQLEYEEKERRARHRSLGNIRCIGELYNLKMLTDRIMHEIIKRLVTQTDEESLECLCGLLNAIGKQLDQCTESKIADGDKTLMSFDHYFGKMEGLVKDEKVPVRVRFLIEDVIDLRKRNWVSLACKKFQEICQDESLVPVKDLCIYGDKKCFYRLSDYDAVSGIITQSMNLTSLKIKALKGDTTESLVRIALKNCPKLVHLDISKKFFDLTRIIIDLTRTIGIITNECPKLKTLSLGKLPLPRSNLIFITGESLKNLSKCKELEELKITNAIIGLCDEGQVKAMFPNCNVKIKECLFRCDCNCWRS